MPSVSPGIRSKLTPSAFSGCRPTHAAGADREMNFQVADGQDRFGLARARYRPAGMLSCVPARFQKCRKLAGAAVLGIAAGTEGASEGRFCRFGGCPGSWAIRRPDFVQPRHRMQQTHCGRMGRAAEEIVHRRAFDDAAYITRTRSHARRPRPDRG